MWIKRNKKRMMNCDWKYIENMMSCVVSKLDLWIIGNLEFWKRLFCGEKCLCQWDNAVVYRFELIEWEFLRESSALV